MPVQTPLEAVDASRLYSKVAWRLIPYLFVLYILAYLDRVNVGFAALDMQRDLHLSYSVYGAGAGVFFLGSALFELPSNLALNKYGPRKWIARIMISWGVVATLMTFVRGAHSFEFTRLLLGISEAGFFPGMILYLTRWFPSHERARAIAKFMTATSIAGVVGAPIASGLLKLEGVAGLHGWQWLFLLEGLPTIAMGFSVLFILRDGPADAPWLTAAEKQWLEIQLVADRRAGGGAERHSLADGFRTPVVWVLAAICLIGQMGVYILNLWMPPILNSYLGGAGGAGGSHGAVTHASSLVARYSTLPYLAAAVCTVLVGWSSDRTGERRGHIAGCLLLSACGCTLAGHTHSFGMALLGMTLAAVGYWSIQGPFWSIPTRALSGRAAAGGVALIMICGGLGGFLGPFITGRLRDITNGFSGGLYAIAGLTCVGAALCFGLRGSRTRTPAITEVHLS